MTEGSAINAMEEIRLRRRARSQAIYDRAYREAAQQAAGRPPAEVKRLQDVTGRASGAWVAVPTDWTPMDDPRVTELRGVLWRALTEAGVRLDDRQAEQAAMAVLAEWETWTDPVP